MPLEKLLQDVSSIKPHRQDFRGLRGKVIYRDGELLSGINLNRILQIVPKLTFLDRIVEKWPRDARFEYASDSNRIVQHIPFLLQPCRKAKSKNKLGFFTLLTDGNGQYWFSSYRDFTQALEESVSSLEALIDEDINNLNREQERVVNKTYRRLTNLLSE